MSTAFDEAWATESPASGLSQDELITEFHRLDAIVKESGAKRAEIGAALAGIARENKATQNTVHLTSTGGQKLKVQFGSETEYVTEEMMEVSKLLGAEVFDGLFETKIKFVPKKRNLTMFFNTVHPDEATQTAKRMIQDATLTREKSPYVSVE